MLQKRSFLVSLFEKTENFLAGKEKLKTFYPIRAYRRRLTNYVLNKYKTNFVEIDDRKMFLDENDSLKLSIREYAKNFTHFAKQQISKGDIVLDLGANIGYWTLLFSQLVGDKGHVFSFEPEPHNFEILKKNVEINQYNNVTIEQKAVSNITGKIKLFLSSVTTADHQIYDNGENRNYIEIDSIRLDDYFKNNNTAINFIKMNIQGGEAEATKGMNDIIKKSSNLIVMSEYTPLFLKNIGMNPKDFVMLFTSKNFSIHDLNPKYENPIPITLEETQRKYTVENNDSTVLIFTKDCDTN